MNDPTLMPDDPRLTAYALGELSGDERAHVEAALRDDPALRATVEEIRATAAQIEAALAAEAFEDAASEARWSGLTASRLDLADPPEKGKRLGVKPLHPQAKTVNGRGYDRPNYRAKLLRFPQLHVILAMAAAACFAFYVHLRNSEYKTRQQVAETNARTAPKRHEAEARAAAQNSTLVFSVTSAPAAPPETGNSAAPRALTESASPPVAAAPPPGTTSPAPPENKLNLLAISKPEAPATPDATAMSPTLLAFSVERTVAPPAEPAAGVKTLGDSSSSAATKTSLPPAIMPKPAEPGNVSGAASPSSTVAIAGRVASVTAFAGPAAATTPPNDEIVRLDAFEVNEDRLRSFISSSAFTNFKTITRGMPEPESLPRPPPGAGFARAREAYAGDNDFVRVTDHPSSRFSVDIDAASYANVRRMIEQGTRPPADAVRIEELVNYFPYRYAAPKDNHAFAASLEVASAPWAPEHRLVRIGLKARETGLPQRAPANLVFLLDVSVSMSEPNKLPFARDAIRLLLRDLQPNDRVAIVTHASRPVVALPSTPVARANEILAALAALKPSGPNDAATGLQLAYQVAIAGFTKSGMNRVILCTDGAFSAGATSERQLLQLIDEKSKAGIALTVLGFGRASEQSAPLERLAHKAGAAYGQVDARREAERLMVEEVRRSLAIIARDVKMEVEFNPARVLAYRLIGYENRPLRREDYSEETGAVGEVGAGQAVTALYEIVPALPTDAAPTPNSEYVRYGSQGAVSSRLEMPDTRKPPGPELLTVNVRYKNPNTLIGWPRTQAFALADGGTAFAEASADFRFAAAVAEFGMILRGSPHRGAGSMRDVVAWANAAATPNDDPRGYRRDFIALARKAQGLRR